MHGGRGAIGTSHTPSRLKQKQDPNPTGQHQPTSRHKAPSQCSLIFLLPPEPCPVNSQASTTLVPGVSAPIPILVSTWDDGSAKLCPEAKAEDEGYQQPHDGTGAAVTSSSCACLFCRLQRGGLWTRICP